jgi:hypothetical protein
MNHGKIETSTRMQDTLSILLEAPGEGWVSTWEIANATRSCAAHSDAAALRSNGFHIDCRRKANTGSKVVYEYRLAGMSAKPNGD